MVYGFGNNMIKLILFGVNVVIGSLGALILAIGLSGVLDWNFSDHLRQMIRDADMKDISSNFENYEASLWVLVAIGSFLLLMGFVGCCGAACESVFFLSIFFFIVLILVIVESAVLLFAFSNKDKFKEDMHKMIDEVYRSDPKSFVDLQKDWNCCGVNGTSVGPTAPECPSDTEGRLGCFQVLWNGIEGSKIVIILVVLFTLLVQLVALVFSCVLCRAFQERVGYSGYV